MTTVWIREHPKRRTRFHRTPDCKQLRKPPAKGVKHELLEVDIADVEVRPCHTCYPDAPAIKIRRPYCPTCNTKYACEHNGAIRVITRAGWPRWVWPDNNQMPYYRRSS